MNQAYDNLRYDLAIGAIDFLTDNIKATLVKSSYVVDPTHADLADLGAHVVSGITPQPLFVTAVEPDGFVKANSIVFTGAPTAIMVGAVILYVDRGSGVTELLWYFDSGTGFPLLTTGAGITVDWNGTAANGIVFKIN